MTETPSLNESEDHQSHLKRHPDTKLALWTSSFEYRAVSDLENDFCIIAEVAARQNRILLYILNDVISKAQLRLQTHDSSTEPSSS